MAEHKGARTISNFHAGKKRFLIMAVIAVTILISAIVIVPNLATAKGSYNNNSSENNLVGVSNTLSVQGRSLDGKPLSMWIALRHQDGSSVKSELTPLSFSGGPGGAYSILASDYSAGGLYFDHWDDGTTSKSRTVTLNGDMQFVAYYRTTTKSPNSPVTTAQSTSIASLIPKTGVVAPLYMYPSSSGSAYWQKVIDEKNKHPSVPVVAVFSPSSGPGKAKDVNVANWVTKLKDSGVIVLGYTYDNYGTRPTSVLKADIDKYQNWYATDGIFIDEFANYAGSEDHYRELTNYAKSFGMKMTMGNPGADVPQSYIGTVDILNISEGRGYVPISQLQYCFSCSTEQGWHYKYDKRNFSYTRYDISSLDTGFVTESSKWIGLEYVTDGNDSNARWFHLPQYFETLMATLDK